MVLFYFEIILESALAFYRLRFLKLERHACHRQFIVAPTAYRSLTMFADEGADGVHSLVSLQPPKQTLPVFFLHRH